MKKFFLTIILAFLALFTMKVFSDCQTGFYPILTNESYICDNSGLCGKKQVEINRNALKNYAYYVNNGAEDMGDYYPQQCFKYIEAP